MPTPATPVPVELRKISYAFSKARWDVKDFSYAKAYVCSVFSQWAYAAISEFDLKQVGLERFSLFNASEVYEDLINSRRAGYFERFILEQALVLEGQEIQRVEWLTVEYDELWVFIAFKLKGIIFVAIRGTTLCARDVVADLKFAEVFPFDNLKRCGFHRGFYREVVDIFEKLVNGIETKLKRRLTGDDVIYVMGHSLGGALSAVLHGYWNRRRYPLKLPRILSPIYSTYTFGMPRYGNKDALSLFERPDDHPHHVLNPWDLVPKLPPRKLPVRILLPSKFHYVDYVDSKFEHSSIACETTLTRKQWKNRVFVEGLLRLRLHLPRGNHSIENYIKDIRKLV